MKRKMKNLSSVIMRLIEVLLLSFITHSSLPLCYVEANVPKETSHQRYSKKKQDGNGFHCNKILAEVAPGAEVSTFFQGFMNDLSRYEKAMNDLDIGKGLKYGVRAKIVCASCESIRNRLTSLEMTSYHNNRHFERYCGSDVYGNDMEHSGLVMIPLVVDEHGNLTEKPGTHMGFIHSRGTKFNRFYVPSGFQPWFGDGRYSETKRDIFIGFVATARMGAVSILPDFMGYGISQAFRSYIIRDAYVTATLPLWIKAGLDLRESTDCKAALANVAYLDGYSEGGKNAAFALHPDGHFKQLQ